VSLIVWHRHRQGLLDIAYHVIQRVLNPREFNDMALYEVASNICLTLRNGPGGRAWQIMLSTSQDIT